jgi:hypothetical protein
MLTMKEKPQKVEIIVNPLKKSSYVLATILEFLICLKLCEIFLEIARDILK